MKIESDTQIQIIKFFLDNMQTTKGRNGYTSKFKFFHWKWTFPSEKKI